MTLDKRQHKRFTLHAQGKVIFDDGKVYEGLVKDISVGGLFLELPRYAPSDIHSVVAVRVQLDIAEIQKVIEAECEIARLTEDGIGMFYTLMDDESKHVLHEVLIQKRKVNE
jgi:hypothetical protein